jgi:1-deoxy-D-xylulose-5-phosphate synthase
MSEYKYLPKIDSPADLKKIPVTELKIVCEEIRNYLIDVISQIGGHFGANLGSVELTVALHYVFNAPYDKLVWDTGHQAYPHKIITGRREALKTIRQFGGISGFLKRTESEYDVFGAGHASTAISAALGIATARDFLKEKFKVIAIVGDGAMTGGMVYEAMNNAGIQKRDLIVVLNDNNMSIAPDNVWQISKYFTQITSSPQFNRFKAQVWDLTHKFDEIGDRIRKVIGRVEGGIKAIITPGALFEALGFRYFGPFNGHNVQQLIKIFVHVKELKGPILVHVVTQKGKGYKPAEEDVQRLHGVTPFDKITGKAIKKSNVPTYTKIFGEALVEIARMNEKVVGITAAMPDGTGLDILQRKIPERFFDVGIAEQHAVTFAAGLATEGIIPVVAIYSTFLQRAFDQIIHDVGIQKLPVVFVLDRAGLVGADGPTHHGAFDLTYLRLVPGMVLMAPKDESELRDMLYTAIEYRKGPIALRYPRGNALGVPLKNGFDKIPIGKGEILRKGTDVALLAIGIMVNYASIAAENLSKDEISCEVVNMRFVKPLDEELLLDIFKRFDKIFVLEENTIIGGLGSAVLEFAAKVDAKNDIELVGLPDQFVEHGTQQELHAMLGIDPKGIADKVRAELHSLHKHFSENN